MTHEQFEKTKKELEEQIEHNKTIMIINNEKRKSIEVSSIDVYAGIMLFLTMPTYLILLFVSGIFAKVNGLNAITNIFPGFTFPIAFMGTVLSISAIGATLVNKKFKKGKDSSFSNSKTKAEKIEESVYYQIELEKAKNRKISIEEAIKILNSNQELLNKIASNYDLHKKNLQLTSAEATTKIETLESILKEQYNKLDVLSTLKVLDNRFKDVNDKSFSVMKSAMMSVMSGFAAAIMTGAPMFIFTNLLPTSSVLPGLLFFITPYLVGTGATLAYLLKDNKDNRKAFDNLKSRLGINNLDKDLVNEREQTLDLLINNQIRDISLSLNELQETKRHVDIKKEDIFDPAIEKKLNEKTSYLNFCDKEKNIEQSNNNLTNEEKGHQLTKKKKLF